MGVVQGRDEGRTKMNESKQGVVGERSVSPPASPSRRQSSISHGHGQRAATAAAGIGWRTPK
jgi:hypothetical protein